MIKVFLVEDEFAVRERMKKNINWEDNGFILVGEAADGEIAYPMIQETEPDIIITDIKMPFMDGLELSRLVKETMPQTKIIILSGYDEFDYAKEAIGIGVIEYLLKPISAQKLLESMKCVAHIIEKEKQQQQSYEKYKLNDDESKKLEKRRFFNHLIASKLSVSTLIEEARALDINLSSTGYNILFVKISTGAKVIENYWETIQNIGKGLEEVLIGCTECVLFDREMEGWAVLIKGTPHNLPLLEEKYIALIETLLKKYKLLAFCIGVGRRVTRLSELAKAFEGASKAVAYSYILPEAQVIYYERLNEYTHLQQDVSIKNVDITKLDKKEVESFLRSGLKSEIGNFTNQYFESMGSSIESLMFRQYIMMSIYLCVVAFVKQLGYSEEYILEACGDLNQVIEAIQTKEEMQSTFKNILTQSLQLRDMVSINKYNLLLDEAKEYMKKNYNEETISLNAVAEYVNISPSHFSTIFSQETGQTFISYLTEIRMEKAKELLRCSNMKTLEIGYAVGYKDPHYFSYLFKKTQKYTPKEYRKANSIK